MLLLKKTFFAFVLLYILTACSKENTTPLELSISKITDSLFLKPVTFGAYVSETPESITWDFGDNTTGTGVSVQHTYKDMGIFQVICTAKLRGKTYTSAVKVAMKGDVRIVGKKRYNGTQTYSTGFANFLTPINWVTRNISDTTIELTAPSDHLLNIFGNNTGVWQHDNGSDVLYQTIRIFQVGSTKVYLFYYPSNDSSFIYYSYAGNGIDPYIEYKLSQKK